MVATVGVLALQGDTREHLAALREAGAEVSTVRRLTELNAVDALVIPGGESTAMSHLLRELELLEPLRDRLAAGMPCYGSCAGMILLAYFPPLWFKVMNPKVVAHFNGDMSRANIKPEIREQVLAQYGRAPHNCARRAGPADAPTERRLAAIRDRGGCRRRFIFIQHAARNGVRDEEVALSGL